MTTKTANELEAFHHFVGERLRSGETDLSPEQSVEAFRAYLHDADRLRKDIEPALEQSERGEARPLDVEALKRRVRDRLAEQGIE